MNSVSWYGKYDHYNCSGDMKEEPTPDLYRAAGLHRKEQFEEAVPPMNPLYFQSGGRHPISAIKEPSKRRPRVTEGDLFQTKTFFVIIFNDYT